ncbi:hypothetical protein ACTXT7_012974 [Hymenolepis weldensis]
MSRLRVASGHCSGELITSQSFLIARLLANQLKNYVAVIILHLFIKLALTELIVLIYMNLHRVRLKSFCLFRIPSQDAACFSSLSFHSFS